MISKSKKKFQISKKVMVLAIVFVLIFQSFVPASLLPQVSIVQAAGTGTVADPIQIRTIQDLKGMANGLDKHYILANDIDFGTSYYWLPIGTSATPFKGSLNGNGFKIKNLLIDLPMNYMGLFGYTIGAKISNLALEGVNIQGAAYVAGLVGYAITGTEIKNCSVSGVIKGTSHYVAGLAGVLNAGNITQCKNTAAISGAGSYNAGIAGYVVGASKISECANYGQISGVQYVGGISGYFNATELLNCYNRGNISGSADRVGGITGFFHSTNLNGFQYCYSLGTISGANYVGGIVGYGNSGSLKNSFALNSRVNASVSYGSRVSGSNATTMTFSNNFAYEDMVVAIKNVGVSIKPTNPALTSVNGYNLALSKLSANATFYETQGWNFGAIWKFIASGYPALLNEGPNLAAQIIKVTGITLNAATKTMNIGEEAALTAAIAPTNATNKAITWSSSNTNIAVVTSGGIVAAKAAGTATITATTQDGSYTAKCMITVAAKEEDQRVNLALHQDVIADSVSGSNTAKKALDGNVNTRWTAKTNTANVNFTIDFKQEVSFEQIIIKEHLNRITNFKLQYQDGTSFVDFYAGTTIGDNFKLNLEDLTIPTPIKTRKINLLVISTKDPSTGGASIFEFEVYGDSADDDSDNDSDNETTGNLALSKTAIASVVSSSNYAKNAVDGDLTTRWLATNNSVGSWLEIDFGKQTTFNQIKLNEAHLRVSSFEIQYFNGSDWTTCHIGDKIGTNYIADFAEVTASKVRIVVTGLSGLNGASIAEIEVYNTQSL